MIYQEELLEQLAQRQMRNPRYSLRSFAKSLNISPTLLSHLLSGKRPLTHRTANLLAEKLALDPMTVSQLQREISKQGQRKKRATKTAIRTLTQDEFRVIADWEHYAVLALAHVPGNRLSPKWIGSRLGIPTKRAKEVADRLLSLELIGRSGKHGFRQLGTSLTTTHGVASTAIQSYHAQNLEKAKTSLFQNTVDERYFGSMTIAIDPADLEKFKTLLRNARGRFETLAWRSRPKVVYHLSMQLFPIDKGESDSDIND